MKYRLVPLIENTFNDTDWIKRAFRKVKRFYKEELGVDLDYMHLKFTTKCYNEDGTIKTDADTNVPKKGAGDWTEKHIVYIRPNQVTLETQHMDEFNKERFVAQVIAHELAHECLHNNLLNLKEKKIPLAKTRYVNTFKKGSDEYKEELYADSLGNYIAKTLYSNKVV